jgi:signal transduction histidine kinase
VAVVKSSLQLLTMRTRSAEQYEEGLERVRVDTERMEELVAKMLTLARLEDGAEQPELYRIVELGDILRDVAEHFQTMANFRRISLVVSADHPTFVLCNPEQLRLLCSNLIDNAIQHGGVGKAVRAIVSKQGEIAQLVVEDDGEGIPKDVLPHVFDRFYRGVLPAAGERVARAWVWRSQRQLFCDATELFGWKVNQDTARALL